MLYDVFDRFAGSDRQILRQMALFPTERLGMAASGAYLLLLCLVTGVSFFLLAGMVLEDQMSGEAGRAWAVMEEILASGLAFLLVWNSYRLMLLTSFPRADEAPDPLRDVSRAFAKIVIAALYGAIVAVPLALALSAAWHGPSSATPPASAWVGLGPGETTNPRQQALLDDYVARQRLLSSASPAAAAPSQGASGHSNPDLVDMPLAQLAQKIRTQHLELLAGRWNAQDDQAPGFVARLETLAHHDPVFLAVTMALLAFLFCVPVLTFATRRKGVYEYLQAMQDIRCLASEGIVPRADVIHGLHPDTEYVRHRFLCAESLARLQRERIDDMAGTAADSRARRRDVFLNH